MVGDAKGGVSGGTIVSLVGAAFDETPEHRRAAADPYGLLPPGAPRGPDKPDYWGALRALALAPVDLHSAELLLAFACMMRGDMRGLPLACS